MLLYTFIINLNSSEDAIFTFIVKSPVFCTTMNCKKLRVQTLKLQRVRFGITILPFKILVRKSFVSWPYPQVMIFLMNSLETKIYFWRFGSLVRILSSPKETCKIQEFMLATLKYFNWISTSLSHRGCHPQCNFTISKPNTISFCTHKLLEYINLYVKLQFWCKHTIENVYDIASLFMHSWRSPNTTINGQQHLQCPLDHDED